MAGALRRWDPFAEITMYAGASIASSTSWAATLAAPGCRRSTANDLKLEVEAEGRDHSHSRTRRELNRRLGSRRQLNAGP
jgi:hypothetical protein